MGKLKRHTRLLVLATGVACLCLAAAAFGVVGALTPQGCIDDNEPTEGQDSCADETDGLYGTVAVAVSRDGKSVYTASSVDDAIVRFDRDTEGALTAQGCIEDNDPPDGPDDCVGSTDGLDDLFSVAVSRDGKSVYTASADDSAIARFDRDAAGALTAQGCIQDNDSGLDTCAGSANGLDNALSVAVSRDGKSAYAAGAGDDAIARFKRNTTTGALTAKGCIEDNDTGGDDCAKSTNGLDFPRSVVVSRNGKSAYAASGVDAAITRFKRSTTTGALTPKGCIDDNDTGADKCGQKTNGLGSAADVAISRDGKSLYATAYGDDAIVSFKRNTKTGALRPKGCIDDDDSGADGCAKSTDGLDGAVGVAVSADGKSVYVTGQQDHAVVRFKRSTKTGALTPKGCVEDNDTGPDDCAASTDGLREPFAVAVSPDDKSVYAVSSFDAAIVRFDRSH